MNDNPINIKFDKASAMAVREPLLNSYGFDLSNENAIGFKTGKFIFTILGFKATAHYERLSVTLKITLNPHIQAHYRHIEKVDLYISHQVNTFCRTAMQVLQVTEVEVKNAVAVLTERLEKFRLDELKEVSKEEKETQLTKKEIDQAKEILKSDNLLECIEGLLKQAGVVTEMENGLRLFLILLSRHFEKPLHALLSGSSQITRMLLEKITSTIPTSEIHEQTSMSTGAMYYTRDKDYWKNRVLFLSSIDKSFKGAVTIREFIENTVLKRQTTESDYLTRQLYSSNKIVQGPICLLGYCEDETFMNRFFQECFFIRVNETDKNRAEMIEHIKMESGGFTDPFSQDEAKRMLKEIQRQIKPKRVVIPYSMELELPEKMFQPLRSLPQLLTFIQTVALLHQHQLKTKRDSNGTEYIEATPEHLEIALELFKSILITQSDILSPAQRNFFERLKTQVKEKDSSFKIPASLQVMRISSSVFYREFNSLKELGYIVKSGGDKKKGIEFKISVWDDYQAIQSGMNILDEQLKKIKQGSFPQVSQKIPSKAKGGKAQLKQAV